MSTELITDGSVISHEGHKYQVRIYPGNGYWRRPGSTVVIRVRALADDGSDLGSYYDNGACDDDPESIEDCVFGIIYELAAKCWPEHERIERERAEVRLQRIVGSHIDFSYEDFDLRR
jgi:hypothetical protein